MMSNLSSIYNTIGRQAESLGKPAAVHTLHNTKSMPLRKETPGKFAQLPHELWNTCTSVLFLVWCLLPEKRRGAPEGAVSKTCQPSDTLFHPDLESAVQIPSPLHLDGTTPWETPHAAAQKAEMPHLPLVLRVPQRGSHMYAARILIREHKIPSHTGRNNFRPAGRQLESTAAAANYVQAQVFHLEEQVRSRFLFQIHSYCRKEVLKPPSFLTGVLQNTCNFMSFYQVSLQRWQGAFILP